MTKSSRRVSATSSANAPISPRGDVRGTHVHGQHPHGLRVDGLGPDGAGRQGQPRPRHLSRCTGDGVHRPAYARPGRRPGQHGRLGRRPRGMGGGSGRVRQFEGAHVTEAGAAAVRTRPCWVNVSATASTVAVTRGSVADRNRRCQRGSGGRPLRTGESGSLRVRPRTRLTSTAVISWRCGPRASMPGSGHVQSAASSENTDNRPIRFHRQGPFQHLPATSRRCHPRSAGY